MQLTQDSSGSAFERCPCRPAKLPDDVDVPACHILILSLGSLSTGKQCLYAACVAIWYTFLIGHGSTLTRWRDPGDPHT